MSRMFSSGRTHYSCFPVDLESGISSRSHGFSGQNRPEMKYEKERKTSPRPLGRGGRKCRFFNSGGCKHGDSCTFRHEFFTSEEKVQEQLQRQQLRTRGRPRRDISSLLWVKAKEITECHLQAEANRILQALFERPTIKAILQFVDSDRLSTSMSTMENILTIITHEYVHNCTRQGSLNELCLKLLNNVKFWTALSSFTSTHADIGSVNHLKGVLALLQQWADRFPECRVSPYMDSIMKIIDEADISTNSVLKADRDRLASVRSTKAPTSRLIEPKDQRQEKAEHCKTLLEQLQLLPTLDEMLASEVDAKKEFDKLPQNQISKPWDADYPEIYQYTHAALLREEFVSPLKDAFQSWLHPDYSKYTSVVYEHVSVTNIGHDYFKETEKKANEVFISPMSCGMFTLHFKPNRKRIDMKSGKFLMARNLVILCNIANVRAYDTLTDQEKLNTLVFATVEHSDPEMLEKGSVGIKLLPGEIGKLTDPTLYNSKIKQSNWIMIESEQFYEAVQPVFEWFKRTSARDFRRIPLLRPLLTGQEEAGTPQYLETAKVDVSTLYLTNKQHLELPRYHQKLTEPLPHERPSAASLNLQLGVDKSQLNVLKHIWSHSVALVQGPPGTGKSYVGSKAAQLATQALQCADNADTHGPVLVVCYTNHALDQFLVDLLPHIDNIVRCGGRTKIESEEFQKCLLRQHREAVQRYSDEKVQMNEIKQHLKSIGLRLQNQYIVLKLSSENDIDQLLLMSLGRSVLDAILQHVWMKFTKLDQDRYTYARVSRNTDYKKRCIEAWRRHENITMIKLYVEKHFTSLLAQYDKNEKATRVKTSNMYETLSSSRDEQDMLYQKAYEDNTYDDDDDDDFQRILEDRELMISDDELDYMYDIIIPDFDMQDLDMYELDLSELDLGFNPATIWKLSAQKRTQMAELIVTKKKEHASTCIRELLAEQSRLSDEYLELQTTIDVNICSKANLVGMTSTFAAKNHLLVQDLQPTVCFVEEAGELLECQLIACLSSRKLQQLILFGDHQQLQPKVNNYQLRKQKYMHISLFERLIKRDLSCCAFAVQRRMRPEICDLIRSLYDNLIDHESVQNYPPVRGVSQNLYWVTHHYQEDESDPGTGLHSPRNIFEADYVVKLTLYLIQQGYAPSEVTILTPYLGQSRLIRQRYRDALDNTPQDYLQHDIMTMRKQTRIDTIDNYQGEENIIVVLSLVRSKKIGFLSESNRMIVGCSRAKQCLLIVGSSALFEESNTWYPRIKQLGAKGKLGETLTLTCQQHSFNKQEITCLSDFDAVRHGGCHEKCKMLLKCGHVCPLLCHPYDHENIGCVQRCSRERPPECTHKCSNMCADCFPCNKCPDCRIPVSGVLPCGHTIPCYKQQTVQQFSCPVNVTCHFTDCGHSNQHQCSDVLNIYPELVHNIFMNDRRVTIEKSIALLHCTHHAYVIKACGHKGVEYCYEEVKSTCNAICGTPLPCGHTCQSICGSVHDHQCTQSCDTPLMCGHQCAEMCGQPHTKKCEQDCQQTCTHGNKCPKLCYEECIPCRQPCGWKCQHYQCTKLCFEECNRPKCDERCTLICEYCGQRCIGLCGETCVCANTTCDGNQKCTISLQDVKDFDVQMDPPELAIKLECGHIFMAFYLDDWFTHTDSGQVNGTRQAIQLKGCPTCRQPIYLCTRYNKYIKQQMLLINQVKKKMNKVELNAEEKRQIAEAMGSDSNFYNSASGHWFACSRGHPYFIGDCGGAMEESRCPECDETIGGTNHRLVSTSTHYNEIDGSTQPAWM